MKTPSRAVLLAASLLILLCLSPLAAQEGAGNLDSEDDKILYAVGLAMGRNLGPLGLSEAEFAIVQRGLVASVMAKETEVSLQEYGPKIQGFVQQRMQRAAAAEKVEGAKFLEAQAAMEGAVRKDSGLILTEITPGTGPNPKATDTVTVHYHGTLRDGTVFDSSVDRGEPATFPLTQVIPCWTEGVQLIKVGGKSRLVCPSEIAYGDQGKPSIPPGSVLVFEVELLGIEGAE